MICKNCGKENGEGVKFCMSCGQPVAPDEMPAAPMGQPVAPDGMPAAPMGQQEGQFGTANGVQANIPGAPTGMPAGQPMAPDGMPTAPMGQPMAPNGMPTVPGGMPGGRPMQAGPMYQMPPMQAVPPAQSKKGNGGVKALILIIVVLLLLCVGILAALGISKSMQQKKFNSLLETAEEYREDQDYEEAVDHYLQALEIRADDKDALNGLTNTYLDWAYDLVADGDYEGALDVLENADSQAIKRKIKAAMEEIELFMEAANAGSSEEDDWPYEDNDWSYEDNDWPEEEGNDWPEEEDFDWSAVGDNGWSDADFVVKGSEGVSVEYGTEIILSSYGMDIYPIIPGANDDYISGDFATARGLEIGMTLADYQNLYPVKDSYALWEYYNDDGTYLNYYSYEDAAYVYENAAADNVYLDLGWFKEGDTWRIMTADEVGDIWACEKVSGTYGEFILLSVGFDRYNEIQRIYMYHASYDVDWISF